MHILWTKLLENCFTLMKFNLIKTEMQKFKKQDWKLSPKCDQILENTEYANKGKRVKLNKKEKQSKMPNLA